MSKDRIIEKLLDIHARLSLDPERSDEEDLLLCDTIDKLRKIGVELYWEPTPRKEKQNDHSRKEVL